MIGGSKKLAARFYVGPGGGAAVREWLLALARDDRRIIGKDIQKVEFGWPIGRPYCAPLGDGLWEVRSALGGNRIARTLFALRRGEMILLHGFIKKTEKIPPAEIALARRRLSALG
jgi:phage-related protein